MSVEEYESRVPGATSTAIWANQVTSEGVASKRAASALRSWWRSERRVPLVGGVLEVVVGMELEMESELGCCREETRAEGSPPSCICMRPDAPEDA